MKKHLHSSKALPTFFNPTTQIGLPGYGGVDIGFLKDQGTLLIGYEPDSQRYFKHHHAATDVFESVDKRELQLGAASITALLYLIDKYGLDF